MCHVGYVPPHIDVGGGRRVVAARFSSIGKSLIWIKMQNTLHEKKVE